MKPTSRAAMSGGWAVTGRKAPEWCGPDVGRFVRRTTRSGAFRPKGLALTARGSQTPASKKKANGRKHSDDHSQSPWRKSYPSLRRGFIIVFRGNDRYPHGRRRLRLRSPASATRAWPTERRAARQLTCQFLEQISIALIPGSKKRGGSRPVSSISKPAASPPPTDGACNFEQSSSADERKLAVWGAQRTGL
jgi:hypothetical protein